MFEILPRDLNLKPIFTQKWVSVDMNWGDNSNPACPTLIYTKRIGVMTLTFQGHVTSSAT